MCIHNDQLWDWHSSSNTENGPWNLHRHAFMQSCRPSGRKCDFRSCKGANIIVCSVQLTPAFLTLPHTHTYQIPHSLASYETLPAVTRQPPTDRLISAAQLFSHVGCRTSVHVAADEWKAAAESWSLVSAIKERNNKNKVITTQDLCSIEAAVALIKFQHRYSHSCVLHDIINTL